MGDANRDEVEKCKQIAQAALRQGDSEKALRFLQKAKRMCPSDGSIDVLIQRVAEGGSEPSPPPSSSEMPRHRASAPPAPGRSTSSASMGGARRNKAGESYTPEMAQEVQRILRTRDYYDILGVPKDSNEDTCKRAYKKLALKLHPDKNKAPGAEEAFKKLSKAVQCLTDEEKKTMYDRYGDEDRIPQQHRQQYQQDFMTPEDLFAAFFGGGTFQTFHHHQGRGGGHEDGGQGVTHANVFQMLPILLLVLLTFASNFASRDSGSRFSFTSNGQYNVERYTATLGTSYYVTQDFEDHYSEGTRALAEFERQVEIYYVRNLHSECDYQEKVMYKKVLMAKRRNNADEIAKARNHPRPSCKEIEKIKRKHNQIFRSAMYMSSY